MIAPQATVCGEKRLMGPYYGSVVPHRDMPMLLHIHDERTLTLDELVTVYHCLDQIQKKK